MDQNKELADQLKEIAETFFVQSMNGWKHHVKASGLSMPQLHLLMFLYHHGNRGVQEIGDCMEITSPAASQLIDRLVNAGYVARSENPDDRRGRSIAITQKGRGLVEKGAEERYGWLHDLMAHLNAKGQDALRKAVPRLLEAARSLDKKTDASVQYNPRSNDIHGEV
jgi:DNA-binding MarR family transcriptional regulator